MAQAKRFQLELASQIVEIEKKLEKLKEQTADDDKSINEDPTPSRQRLSPLPFREHS
jgi:hypothetical protein